SLGRPWPLSDPGWDARVAGAREALTPLGTLASGTPNPTHPLQLAAKAFARSALAADHLDPRSQLDDDRRRRVVDVTGRGNRRADAIFDWPNYFNDALARGNHRVHSVAGTN